MKYSLDVKKEDDGTYTATINGILNNEPIASARSMGNSLANDAVARAAMIFCRKFPDLGVSIHSVDDLK